MRSESVWDYPRPPAIEPFAGRVRVELGGRLIAQSEGALRVLETSHPPTIYLPPGDVRADLLIPSPQPPTWCEFKGAATYLDAVIDGGRFVAVAWSYAEPSPGYESLAGHVSFYPGRVSGAWLDDERVDPQPGDFYGGWVTANLRGPFKGGAGTSGW